MCRTNCSRIYYREIENGMEITACFGFDSDIYLPDEIDGKPVLAIAPYAFSDHELSKEDLIWQAKESFELFFSQEQKRLQLLKVHSVRLPKGLKQVGRYAFYRCRNLKKLILSDEIYEIGGGALNGCAISELEIHFYHGTRSALKSILEEMRYEIKAELYYHESEDRTVKAELIYLEHYEEAVENTPARILYTSHHGAGGYYRQCFFDRKVDYKKFDELLPYAKADGNEDSVISMAVSHIRYPYELSEQAREDYLHFLKEHSAQTFQAYIRLDDREMIHFLLDLKIWDQGELEACIETAQQYKRTEIFSILIEEKRKKFPSKKKTFDL